MSERVITSTSNRLVKLVRQLATRQGREKAGAFVVEGARAVDEALDARKVRAVFFDEQQLEKPLIASLLMRVQAEGVEIVVTCTKLFAELADTQSPQGVLAIVDDISVGSDHLSTDSRLIVISDALQDPGNIGTLIRLADAIGADAFVATKGSVDVFNPKTVRASMGSLFHLPVLRDVVAYELVALLKSRGYKLVAADVQGTIDHFDYDFSLPVAVVFGNEGAGLSPCWLEHADLVRIPMPGRAESLNVGAAAAVMLYEIVRQMRQA